MRYANSSPSRARKRRRSGGSISVSSFRSDAKPNTSVGAGIGGGGEATKTNAVISASTNKPLRAAAPKKTIFIGHSPDDMPSRCHGVPPGHIDNADRG